MVRLVGQAVLKERQASQRGQGLRQALVKGVWCNQVKPVGGDQCEQVGGLAGGLVLAAEGFERSALDTLDIIGYEALSRGPKDTEFTSPLVG